MVMSAVASYFNSKGEKVEDGRTKTGFRTEGESPFYAFIAGVIVLLLSCMARWLINGERVYEERNWNRSTATVTENG